MNSKVARLLRKFAKDRGINYRLLKKAFLASDWREKTEEMEKMYSYLRAQFPRMKEKYQYV